MSVKIRDRQTGEVREVAPETAQQLLPTGQFGIEAGDYNVTKGNKTVAVDAQGLYTAIDEGWRIESDEEARTRTIQTKYGDRGIAAGAAGAARGLSFGLSDQLMTKALGVRKETLAGLKEANPGISFGSELGSVALSIIGTGGLGAGGQVAGRGAIAGTSAVARAGQAAKAAAGAPGLLARTSAGIGKKTAEKLIGQAAGETMKREIARNVARRGIEGAIEGAAYSVGNLVSEEALGNAELSAENVLASAGLGAVLGVGVGGAIGAGGVLFSRGAKNISNLTATRASIKKGVTGATEEAASQAAEQTAQDAARETTAGFGGAAWDSLREKAAVGSSATLRKTVKAAREFLDEQGMPKTRAAIDDIIDKARMAGEEVSKDLDETVLRMLPDFSPKGLGNIANERTLKAIGAIQSDLKRMRKAGIDGADMATFLREATDESGEKLFKAGMGVKQFAEVIPKALRKTGETLGKIRKQADELASANNMQPDFGELVRGLTDDVFSKYADSDIASMQALGKKVLRELGPAIEKHKKGEVFTLDRIYQLRRHLDEGLFPDGKLPGQGKQAIKEARRYVEDFITDEMDRIFTATNTPPPASYLGAKRAYRYLIEAERVVEGGVDRLAGNRLISLTDTGVGVGGMSAGAAIGGGPFALAGALGGTLAHKMIRERGSSVAAIVADNLSKRMAVAKANAAATEAIQKAVRKTLAKDTAGTTAKSTTKSSARATGAKAGASSAAQEAFGAARRTLSFHPGAAAPTAIKAAITHEQFSSIQKTLIGYNSPENVSERVGVSLADTSQSLPKTSSALSAKAVTATQFLLAKMPRAPGDGSTLTPLVSNWKPSKSELAKFTRYLKAVENPMGVLDDLADGRVSREAVEALREVYPRIYEATRRELAMQAAELKERIPYATNIKLSLFFDVPLDPSMRPEALRRVQAGPDPEQAQGAMTGMGQGAGGMRLTGIDKLKMSKQYETETGRLASSL